MMATPISFHCDEVLLRGRFHAAGKAPSPTVVLLQGTPGNEDDVLGLGERFARHGYHTLTFNHSGMQRSAGLSSFAHSQRDIEAAYRFLAGEANITYEDVKAAANENGRSVDETLEESREHRCQGPQGTSPGVQRLVIGPAEARMMRGFATWRPSTGSSSRTNGCCAWRGWASCSS